MKLSLIERGSKTTCQHLGFILLSHVSIILFLAFNKECLYKVQDIKINEIKSDNYKIR